MKKIDSAKIARYIKGIPDESDKEYMDSLFSLGEDNQFLKDTLEDDWDNFNEEATSEEINLNSLLNEIHHTITITEFRKKKKKIRRIFETYRMVAAVLLMPMIVASGISLVHLSNQQKTSDSQSSSVMIYAPLGSRINFNLPDGTKGMLNSGSYLSYSIPFTKRHVELEGEAWFEVSPDVTNPFRVFVGSSEVEVLGTSFNLSAYSTENYVELVLLNGKVDFFNNKLEDKIRITPSHRLVFQDGIVDTALTDPQKYIAWTSGQLVFRGDPMSEVARRIERWYNVKVILADNELEKYSFRGTFEDDKLEDVLKLLAMTSPIAYSIIPSEQLPDGSFRKEEITIYKKAE